MTGDLYIGVMTGNSMDAADAVLVSFADNSAKIIAAASVALETALVQTMRQFAGSRQIDAERLLLAQNALTDHCARAVGQLRADLSLVRAIGCHGQTVAHIPAAAATWQLLNPARLVEQAGVSVVCDFRSRDIAGGGQGAPLAPFFHQYFFSAHAPCQIINLGGIANISCLDGAGNLSAAYDTGPGMLLLDAFYRQQHDNHGYDKAGAYARQGSVRQSLLKSLLRHPYFSRPPPKSCGREEFSLEMLPPAARDLPAADVQATLLEFTAQTVASAISEKTVFLCGGGSMNCALVERLSALSSVKAQISDAVGLPAQSVEATAFAYLAKCHLDGSPLAAAAVTGGQTRIAGGYYPK